jgi:hypothetical protein
VHKYFIISSTAALTATTRAMNIKQMLCSIDICHIKVWTAEHTPAERTAGKRNPVK